MASSIPSGPHIGLEIVLDNRLKITFREPHEQQHARYVAPYRRASRHHDDVPALIVSAAKSILDLNGVTSVTWSQNYIVTIEKTILVDWKELLPEIIEILVDDKILELAAHDKGVLMFNDAALSGFFGTTGISYFVQRYLRERSRQS